MEPTELSKIVNLHHPEQNINGPFQITSIKHILPQKIPTAENLKSDFDFRPITAIFTHESNNVWVIKFENGDSLGATYVHPIFTNEGWKATGEIKAGDEVLTYTGYSKAVSNNQLAGTHLVYNLEVKDLHNFLVGSDGVVVHNSYAKFLKHFWPNSFVVKKLEGKKWIRYIEESGIDPDDKEYNQLEWLGEKLQQEFIHLHNRPGDQPFQGIDALDMNGRAITLKFVEAFGTVQDNTKAMFKKIGKLNKDVPSAKVKDAVGVLHSELHTISQLETQIKKAIRNPQTGLDKSLIEKIFFKGIDGDGVIIVKDVN